MVDGNICTPVEVDRHVLDHHDPTAKADRQAVDLGNNVCMCLKRERLDISEFRAELKQLFRCD